MKWKLENEPITYQLSVHINNYISNYGMIVFIRDIEHYELGYVVPAVIENILGYYGVSTVKQCLYETFSKAI